MSTMSSARKPLAWPLAGAVIVPLAIFSAYLLFSRGPKHFDSAVADWAALGISTLAGTAFVALLPVRVPLRAVFVLIYVPLCGTLLFYYCFLFVGMVFGDSL